MDLNASAGRACSESIAISAIALDNYFHLLHPMKESEFDFACNGFRFSVGITGARAWLTGGGVVPGPFRRAGFYFPVRLWFSARLILIHPFPEQSSCGDE